MILPDKIIRKLRDYAFSVIYGRNPDFVIGGKDNAYLERWYVIPRNPIFNIYLHKFLRSDDDRALHDHPWWNASIILKGNYIEHKPGNEFYLRVQGGVYLRLAKEAHRIQLLKQREIKFSDMDLSQTDAGKIFSLGEEREMPVITLFITGPRFREWGFYCPRGWRHWMIFTQETSGESLVGRGCE